MKTSIICEKIPIYASIICHTCDFQVAKYKIVILSEEIEQRINLCDICLETFINHCAIVFRGE